MFKTFFAKAPTTATLGFHICVYLSVICLIFAAQTLLGDYALRIFNNILIFVILAVSYNLINGVTGQLSLEPNGFVAIGAYITALMLLDSDLMGNVSISRPAPLCA